MACLGRVKRRTARERGTRLRWLRFDDDRTPYVDDVYLGRLWVLYSRCGIGGRRSVRFDWCSSRGSRECGATTTLGVVSDQEHDRDLDARGPWFFGRIRRNRLAWRQLFCEEWQCACRRVLPS